MFNNFLSEKARAVVRLRSNNGPRIPGKEPPRIFQIHGIPYIAFHCITALPDLLCIHIQYQSSNAVFAWFQWTPPWFAFHRTC